jgi:hypothetical protein
MNLAILAEKIRNRRVANPAQSVNLQSKSIMNMHKRIASAACWALGALASCLLATSSYGQFAQSSGPITINDSSTATPYPSEIEVKDVVGTLEKVTVKLNKLSHSYPDDIDIVLKSPTGKLIVLMSDTGLDIPVSGVDILLDDAATTPLPDSTEIFSGFYKPTDVNDGPDSYPTLTGPSALRFLFWQEIAQTVNGSFSWWMMPCSAPAR